MISGQTLRCLALACLILSTSTVADTRLERREQRRLARIAAHRSEAESEELPKTSGRNLQGDPCRDQIDNCFNLSGCMKCKSFTNGSTSNGDGHIQCLSVAGNESFLAGVGFEGCCTETEGGTNGKGETCHFWKHQTSA